MLSEKRWRADRLIWLACALVASISLGMLVVQGYGAALGEGRQGNLLLMVAGTLTFHGLTLLVVNVFLRDHQTSWREGFGFAAPRPGRTVLLAVLAGVIVLPIAWSLGHLSVKIMNALGTEVVAQQSVQALQTTKSAVHQIYFGLVAVLLAPFVEEVVFRGILYPAIKQQGFPQLALWGTSLFFAATHANVMTFVPLAFLAVILTLLYESTNNLLAPIVCHAVFNAANFSWLLWQLRGQNPL